MARVVGYLNSFRMALPEGRWLRCRGTSYVPSLDSSPCTASPPYDSKPQTGCRCYCSQDIHHDIYDRTRPSEDGGFSSSPILDCLQSLHGPICEALSAASQRKGAVSHSLTDLLGMFLNPPQTGKPRAGEDSFRYHCQSLFYPCTHPLLGFFRY